MTLAGTSSSSDAVQRRNRHRIDSRGRRPVRRTAQSRHGYPPGNDAVARSQSQLIPASKWRSARPMPSQMSQCGINRHCAASSPVRTPAPRSLEPPLACFPDPSLPRRVARHRATGGGFPTSPALSRVGASNPGASSGSGWLPRLLSAGGGVRRARGPAKMARVPNIAGRGPRHRSSQTAAIAWTR